MTEVILASRTENYITFVVLISLNITIDRMKMLFGLWHLISIFLFQ